MNNQLYNDGIDYKGKKYQKEIPTEWQLKRYTNKKFGKLLVECPVWVEGLITKPDNTNAIWLTHCECGNDYCVSMQWIRKEIKKGLIPDCGCGARIEQDKKYIGKVFGQLTVIERDDDYKKNHQYSNYNTYYRCKCSCGKETIVRINTLVAGEVKSCGCLKKEQEKINLIPQTMHDLTGQRFGKLTALSPFKQEKDLLGDYWWHCQCDCGNMIDVRGYSLVSGDTQSCGCLTMSKGEDQIINLLKEHKLKFLHDLAFFKDLILPSGGIGRYDFILLNEFNHPYRLIEFDGKQHFVPIRFFGGEQGLKKLQDNDNVKNEYAKQHNLPLVRIPYTIKQITIDMILGDEFLI